MSAAVLGSAMACAAGAEPDAILRFLHNPSPPPRIVLPEAGIGIPFRAAEPVDWHDTQRLMRMAAETVARALDAAGLDEHERRETAVLVGSSSLDIGAVEASRRGTTAIPLADQRNRLAEQLATRFGLGETRVTLNAACASSSAALLYGLRFVESGRARHVLVVGAEGLNQLTAAGFSALHLLADTECAPFAASRNGMVLGEAVAAVVLGADDSGRDWSLAGGALNCDPQSPTASSSESMAAVMRTALEDADVTAGMLRAVKVHGTGSRDSDHAEAFALQAVFASQPPLTGFKAMLGHTLGACGALEWILLMHAVDSGWLPPACGADADPALPVAEPAAADEPGAGYYLLNTFGFGGNNAALVARKKR